MSKPVICYALEDYPEYRCSACKKTVKQTVVQCKTCIKFFYHPGCANKHKICNKAGQVIQCNGPFVKFSIEEPNPTTEDNTRERIGSTESSGATIDKPEEMASGSGVFHMDDKINWIIKNVKEMKEDAVCKQEIREIIKEVVEVEIRNIKQELEELKKMLCGKLTGTVNKSYSEVTKEKKKENVIVIKPKIQQESEATKKIIKEKVDIKNMSTGITKLRKGNRGTVIMGCETGEELKELKVAVETELGKDYNVTEVIQMKPKLKIVYVGEDEMNLDDGDLATTIKKQNRLEEINKENHIRILRKITMKPRNGSQNMQVGCVIIETDDITHDFLLNNGKVNIGWRKCRVFDHINVKRCFKCWGFHHMAKNCKRAVACHKCAGNHVSTECLETKKKCVNCLFKIKTYNVKIDDEHDALSQDCPSFKKVLEEEKRRAGWVETK